VSSGSWASSDGVQRSMRSNRGRDTSPEMAVRRAVWARGMRYRVDTRPLPELNRRADLVFRRERVAVFIDGCYWHSCPHPCDSPEYQQRLLGPQAREHDRTRPRHQPTTDGPRLERPSLLGTRRRRRSRRCGRTGRARPHPIDQLRGGSRPIRLAPSERSAWSGLRDLLWGTEPQAKADTHLRCHTPPVLSNACSLHVRSDAGRAMQRSGRYWQMTMLSGRELAGRRVDGSEDPDQPDIRTLDLFAGAGRAFSGVPPLRPGLHACVRRRTRGGSGQDLRAELRV
jgi:DNA mismatch endonuclease Vsr